MSSRTLLVILLGLTAPLTAQTISGKITDRKDGTPLAKALVTLEPLESGTIDSVRTGADGTWSLLITS
ncbi:MAG TPA: carboxypeptidase-like regulatory domain-containing protein, partial [bacterium]|nr:carboxypeptidase-like regulatory domain-containing protein [bacterium]